MGANARILARLACGPQLRTRKGEFAQFAVKSLSVNNPNLAPANHGSGQMKQCHKAC